MIVELLHDHRWVPLPDGAVDDAWFVAARDAVRARHGGDDLSAAAVVDAALAMRRPTDELALLALAGAQPTVLHVLVAHVDDVGDLGADDLVGLSEERVLEPAVSVLETEHLDDARVARHLVRDDDGDVALLIVGATSGPWRIRVESEPMTTLGLGTLLEPALTVLATLRLAD